VRERVRMRAVEIDDVAAIDYISGGRQPEQRSSASIRDRQMEL